MVNLPDPAEQFAAVLVAGIGLVLIGLIHVLMASVSGKVRVAATAAACVAILACVGYWPGGVSVVVMTGGVLAVVLGPAWVLASPRFRAMAARAIGWVRRPLPQAALVAAAGVVVAVIAVARFEDAQQRQFDEDMKLLEAEAWSESLVPIGEEVAALTDRGARIMVGIPSEARSRDVTETVEMNYLNRSFHASNLIRREPASDLANCHGWVFSGGRYLVPGRYVDRILDDNGYDPVSEPRPGDLVIYRNNGTVSHTALVRYVTDGMPVIVEGKWGRLGVFLHPVHLSCYGTDFTYYRSSRPGHLLAGLSLPSPTRANGG